MEGYQCVVLVVLAGQQGLQLLTADALLEFGKTGLKLFEHGLVFGLDGQLTQSDEVFPLCVHAVEGLDLFLERTHTGDDLLRSLRVIPETGLRRLHFQLVYLTRRLLETQVAAQFLDRRFKVVQFYLVFFKLQHLSCSFTI